MSAFSSVSTACTTESRMAYISCVGAAGSGTTGWSRMLSLKPFICSSGTLTKSAIHASDSASCSALKIGSAGVPIGASFAASASASATACVLVGQLLHVEEVDPLDAGLLLGIGGVGADGGHRAAGEHAGVVAREGQDRQPVRGRVDLVLGDEAVVDVRAGHVHADLAGGEGLVDGAPVEEEVAPHRVVLPAHRLEHLQRVDGARVVDGRRRLVAGALLHAARRWRTSAP